MGILDNYDNIEEAPKAGTVCDIDYTAESGIAVGGNVTVGRAVSYAAGVDGWDGYKTFDGSFDGIVTTNNVCLADSDIVAPGEGVSILRRGEIYIAVNGAPIRGAFVDITPTGAFNKAVTKSDATIGTIIRPTSSNGIYRVDITGSDVTSVSDNA